MYLCSDLLGHLLGSDLSLIGCHDGAILGLLFWTLRTVRALVKLSCLYISRPYATPLSIYVSIHLFVYLYVCLPMVLPTYLPTYLSICRIIGRSFYIIYIYIHVRNYRDLCLCLGTCLHVHE